MASRRECLQIERLALLVVADNNAQVINHWSSFDCSMRLNAIQYQPVM
jgi:hypothetical protein